MNPLKKLAGQTAIYGISSIVGRIMNFLLVPWYTRVFTNDQYGVVTEMYAYVAFLIVVLTYGLETAYFRFTTSRDDEKSIYSTVLLSIVTSSLTFIVVCSIFSVGIGNWLGYPNHTEYVIWFAIIIGLDAISAVPLAKLRQQGRAKKFMLVNMANVVINIAFNVFFLIYCPAEYEANGENSNALVSAVYNPEIGVGYVFIANLIASMCKLALLMPAMNSKVKDYSFALLKTMMKYSLPLMILGLAGIVNETLDRVLLKKLLPMSELEALKHVGVYGACYKVTIILSLCIQAFRYAAEPFFFAQEHLKNSKQIYAIIMKYFVIFGALVFLGITVFMDVALLLIGEEFRSGKDVIPILLSAYLCFGIVYNLSFWYKLTEKTMYGAGVAIFGGIITVILNWILIPEIGYMGSAWATLACYASMMVVSYILGQRHYKIEYPVGRILFYFVLAYGLYFLNTLLNIENTFAAYALRTVLVLIFISVSIILEKKEFKEQIQSNKNGS